jgi:hypothetical protein
VERKKEKDIFWVESVERMSVDLTNLCCVHTCASNSWDAGMSSRLERYREMGARDGKEDCFTGLLLKCRTIERKMSGGKS